ncbi:ribose 5-phosphate isomerase B [Oribacterium sp. oral taxon 102]|uniref:ribose 5-phosphate isomerase B n=1 Tax=Oribacterium sp. oral taxon 102 TaxID=671214 RepID=UPI0015BDAAD5|nr:ribose 5-phosphate isomerase B [Oribacterium sp. oral taxon 102]NWO20749.1 ribose 5-phosphate isomerase B [Oribacterium sp. oral taxon 102]
MKIVIGNDHAAVEMKQEIMQYLLGKGIEVLNVGTDSRESYDYPRAGFQVARAVAAKEADCGIAICGTGIGISLAANKVQGIRAFACSEPYSAEMAKRHNDANVLCFGARVVGIELAKKIVDAYLDAKFEGGRHQRRVDLIMDIERNGGLSPES